MNPEPRRLPILALLALLLLLGPATLRADEEQDLLAVLQSNASVPDKCAACQKLRLVGTPRAVPALAAALGDERVGHAARFALEALPGPEAGTALREALPTLTGPARLGVIGSLGWRREPAAIPLLAPFLTQPDAALADAAAAALGRIAGPDATRVLLAARDQTPAPARPTLLESLLQCADDAFETGDVTVAIGLYQKLANPASPDAIRTAAWIGLLRNGPHLLPRHLLEGLTNTDPAIVIAALQSARTQYADFPVGLHYSLNHWSSLPEAAQLALLDAAHPHPALAETAIRHGSASPHTAVRLAAWQALGDHGDDAFIPALAKAAANGQPAERTVARDTLARLRGEWMTEALLQYLATAPTPERAELLRVLGDRDPAPASTPVLLAAAAAPEPAVRAAALESLRKLALPETLDPLLDLAARAPDEAAADPVLQALFALCRTAPDKDALARQVVAGIQRQAPGGRRLLLALLPELPTPATLDLALAATRDPDAALVREAVRALGQWPTPAPADRLLELAGTAPDQSLQILALRSFIEVAAQEPQPAARLAHLQKALTTARRPEEKLQALGQIGQIPTPEALQTVLPALQDPALAGAAAQAAIGIAEKIRPTHPTVAALAAELVLTTTTPTADLMKRAWTLRGKTPASGPFLQDWLVAGPYRQAGANDAMALFDVAFAPEKPGDTTTWKPAPRADIIPLTALFPDQVGCVAYLKTTVIAPRDTEALLLLGSDDGIKAWVNGTVVHANNVDRGAVPDQDLAPIRLRAGANQLLLKVTQGGGGWAACARIVAPDGQAIPGLEVRPTP